MKTIAQQLWVLGKLSHAGSRRYRDYVIQQLSPICIKMGQHSLYMKSTTGYIFSFIYNCLALLRSILFSHSFCWRWKAYILWTWLPLGEEIGGGLKPPEHRCQRRLKTVLKRVRYEMETHCAEVAAPGRIHRHGSLTGAVLRKEWKLAHGAGGLVQPPAWLTRTRRAQSTGLAFCWVSVLSASVIFYYFQSRL